MSTLIWGLITGIIFGFLLQKGQVLRYEKQLGALLFKDFTIVKFMLSTVIISMIGIYLLYDIGLIKLSIKSTGLGANIIGGLVFGIGWGLLGYCPATAAGALGEGRWDSLFGIIGMLFGAAFYAEAYPALKTNILAWGKKGEITLYGILGINHWIVILILIIIFCIVFYWFEKKKL
ncbi:MAG TPA: YeeE/YedE thiosulfate transporter family protein [Desulfobacteraceae bacterium]|nr:YeeE/YedE thiosulfate transporter family protein [Desulfobacteraceae bacterium]HPJ68459.1 YeeE/YedE thiosulfate transporter family protein [Desulfobacteraceae bacterium]HPQ28076.1 YeeE/YedE thiosulfate transporter family protein [Desulfobacteraceae bacterium]